MMETWFEDCVPGKTIESAGATITESQILEFAWTWDPQPFHIDVPAAENGPFGGLIASGLHTLLISFRLFWATGGLHGGGAGSPGFDELRWLKPVRPGDTLRVRAEVAGQRPSRSRKDRGTVDFLFTTLNQDDVPLMTWKCAIILMKRPV